MLGQATWIQLKLIYIFVKGLSSITKKGRLKALVWFWWIDETLSANLVYQSYYEIGITTPSGEANEDHDMMMVMIKCLNLEKEKGKQKAQGKGISGRSLFVLVIKTLSECDHI